MSESKYYPHNWEAIKELPEELIGLIDYEDLMFHRVLAWEVPSSVDTIIRATNYETKKVREFVYTRAGNARNKLLKLVDEGDCEILVCRDDTMYQVSKNSIYIEENNDYED